MLGPHGAVEHFRREVMRLILVHHHLFQDHLPLFVDIRFIQLGVEYHIHQYVQRGLQVIVAYPCVVAGALLLREGIQVAPLPLNRTGNVERRARGRTLEHEVLQEVARTTHPPGFVPGADSHPDSDGHTLDVRQGRRHHPHAIRQFRLIHILKHTPGSKELLHGPNTGRSPEHISISAFQISAFSFYSAAAFISRSVVLSSYSALPTIAP